MTEEGLKTALNLIASMNFDDIRKMYNLLSARTEMLQQQAKCKFDIGDYVKFNSKYGEQVRGTITKINQKTIKMKAESGMVWTVSPSLLSRAA